MVLWIRGIKWVYEKLCLVGKQIHCWRVEVMSVSGCGML